MKFPWREFAISIQSYIHEMRTTRHRTAKKKRSLFLFAWFSMVDFLPCGHSTLVCAFRCELWFGFARKMRQSSSRNKLKNMWNERKEQQLQLNHINISLTHSPHYPSVCGCFVFDQQQFLSLSFECEKFALIWIEFTPNLVMTKKFFLNSSEWVCQWRSAKMREWKRSFQSTTFCCVV